MIFRYNEDLNEFMSKSDSALHFAARFGHMESVAILVKEGANLRSRNVYGNTPLQVMSILKRFLLTYYNLPGYYICFVLKDPIIETRHREKISIIISIDYFC